MTRIFDDPAAFADEALTGFVAANRRYVARVDGGVVRATEMTPDQVALVIGGGSGHYPAFAGLVGQGLAAGSACGNMFASPAAAQIYRVAKAAQAGGGVLLSYGNYAGDVLHFGQAQERLNAEGIPTRTVVVTDDIASASPADIDKRRGIAGDLTVFKIAGAAADAGLDLAEVERLARKANLHTRSLGVAFNGCTLPGATEPLFSVPADQMSLGLGIHGEPGISDHDLPTASELAELLVGRLLAERPAGAGTRVVPIVNGLGTVKYDELFLLFGKIETLLRDAGLDVVEPECGELVTSLDMSGLSLTLFWVDDELLNLWTAPADTPAFRRGNATARPQRTITLAESDDMSDIPPATAAATRLGAVALTLLQAVQSVVVENEQDWGRLDAIAGDGDHGIGMRRGVDAAVKAATETSREGGGVDRVLAAAGAAWSEKAGGTSGALWGAALCASGGSLGNRESYGPTDALGVAESFSSAIIDLGKAELGDKTMVDAVLPYVAAFTAESRGTSSVSDTLTVAATAAVEAAAGTAGLSPRRGRARPLAERSIGHPDPGAVSFGLIAAGVARAYAGFTAPDFTNADSTAAPIPEDVTA